MLHIRAAFLEDAADLLNTRISAFKLDEELYGMGPPGFRSIDSILQSINEGRCYTILKDTRIIGGVIISSKGGGHYRLNGIWINPQYQNNGFGSQVITFIENELKDKKSIFLNTPHKSYRNHHFYEKIGFKKIGEDREAVDSCDDYKRDFYLFLYQKNYD
jgi:ribosomal protein S18 acetylase RimI-like enzyme